jgi:uncharacterized protein
MISDSNWNKIRSVFDQGFNSCLHFSLATVNEDGSPNVAPIGALILREKGSGFFFDEYSTRTRNNLNRDPRVCVLAVNSDRAFWGKSLGDGKFVSPPAVRLHGVAEGLREAKNDEIEVWQKRIIFARGLKGYELMWSHLRRVRDLHFDTFEPVDAGDMTSGLW